MNKLNSNVFVARDIMEKNRIDIDDFPQVGDIHSKIVWFIHGFDPNAIDNVNKDEWF